MGFSTFDDLVNSWDYSHLIDTLLVYATSFVWIHAQKSKESKAIVIDLVFAFPELYFLQKGDLLPRRLTAMDFAPDHASATKTTIAKHMTAYSEDRLESHARKIVVILQQREVNKATSSVDSSTNDSQSEFWSRPQGSASSHTDVLLSHIDDLVDAEVMRGTLKAPYLPEVPPRDAFFCDTAYHESIYYSLRNSGSQFKDNPCVDLATIQSSEDEIEHELNHLKLNNLRQHDRSSGTCSTRAGVCQRGGLETVGFVPSLLCIGLSFLLLALCLCIRSAVLSTGIN
jgi:hypothetical protein